MCHSQCKMERSTTQPTSNASNRVWRSYSKDAVIFEATTCTKRFQIGNLCLSTSLLARDRASHDGSLELKDPKDHP